MRPDDFFTNSLWPRKTINGLQRYIPRQGILYLFDKKKILFYFNKYL